MNLKRSFVKPWGREMVEKNAITEANILRVLSINADLKSARPELDEMEFQVLLACVPLLILDNPLPAHRLKAANLFGKFREGLSRRREAVAEILRLREEVKADASNGLSPLDDVPPPDFWEGERDMLSSRLRLLGQAIADTLTSNAARKNGIFAVKVPKFPPSDEGGAAAGPGCPPRAAFILKSFCEFLANREFQRKTNAGAPGAMGGNGGLAH